MIVIICLCGASLLGALTAALVFYRKLVSAAELEKHGVAVSGRPGEDRCIYFRDPDGHRLQLMVRP